jgi:tRNA(fMet)-specific endonuclease VapC
MKLLDTSVLVDIDRGGVDRKVRKLDDQGQHTLSMVSVTELQLGVNIQYEQGTNAHQEARDELARLLARFEIVPITRPIATTAADIITELRQHGRPIDDLHDVYIAATAIVEQLPVLTGNVDHFDRIEDLEVINWQEF